MGKIFPHHTSNSRRNANGDMMNNILLPYPSTKSKLDNVQNDSNKHNIFYHSIALQNHTKYKTTPFSTFSRMHFLWDESETFKNIIFFFDYIAEKVIQKENLPVNTKERFLLAHLLVNKLALLSCIRKCNKHYIFPNPMLSKTIAHI
jgi:hypothetical protein